MVLASSSCNTDLCKILEPSKCASDIDQGWIYESLWFDNQIDLRVADNGVVRYKRLGGTSNIYLQNFTTGDYTLLIRNSAGEIMFSDRIPLNAEYSTHHWPARIEEETLQVMDKNCQPVKLLNKDGDESYEINVRHLALRI